jgi:hypothetical protein
MLDNNYQISRYYFTGIMKRNINSDTMNWNSIIKKEVRGINDAYLGTVQGISEPFIITKKGIVIKENFFIPKSLLEGYDDIIVYCKIDEKDARNNFIRNLQPLHDDYYSNYTITDINDEGKLQNNINKKNTRNNTFVYDEAELIKNIKGTSNKITEIIQSVVRTTEQKIKEAPIVIKKLEEVNLETIAKETSNTIKRLVYAGFKVAAANLSKMSQFAIQFLNSFEYILSNIRRRTYSRRERIQHFSK